MVRMKRRKNRNLGFEPLEGRALLSGAGFRVSHASDAAVVFRPHSRTITDSSAGEAAILNAMAGGAGHEFVTLAMREVHNIFGVVSRFESGAAQSVHHPGDGFQDRRLAARVHRVPP